MRHSTPLVHMPVAAMLVVTLCAYVAVARGDRRVWQSHVMIALEKSSKQGDFFIMNDRLGQVTSPQGMYVWHARDAS